MRAFHHRRRMKFRREPTYTAAADGTRRRNLDAEPARQQEDGDRHLFNLSCALYLGRRYEESIHAARRAKVRTPQSNIARKYLATSLAQLGRTDEARAEIAELVKHQPSASLSYFRLRPLRHKWMNELHLEGLRKAGLRESNLGAARIV